MSAPSQHVLNGYKGRQAGKNLMRACVSNAELVRVIIDDLTDGDNDVRTAIQAANALGMANVLTFDFAAEMADGDMLAMLDASKKLAANGGTTK